MKIWEGLNLSSSDIARVLVNYKIGELIGFKTRKRPEAEAPASYLIMTSKGKYYLKQYRKKGVMKSHLDLVKFLMVKRYPCAKLVITRKNALNIQYKEREFAIFEFVNGKQSYNLKYDEAYQLGMALGKLHKLTLKLPMEKAHEDYSYFLKLFNQNCKRKAPTLRNVKMISFIKDNLTKTNTPKGIPMSVCHSELTSDHALYRKGKLVAVIDWDGAGREYMIRDIGSCLYSAFEYEKGKFKLNFDVIAGIMDGYQKERKLTKWEGSHIYEAVMFGAFKNAIWELSHEKINWNSGEFRFVETFMNYSKGSFNKALG